MSAAVALEYYVAAIAAQPLVGLLVYPLQRFSHRLARALPVASSAALLAILLLGVQGGTRGVIPLVKLDPLSQIFSLMIALIGFLCMLYSYEYMARDPSPGRYYFWMLTFLSSMLLLVIADSVLLFLLAWELTSLCSFSLISHWNFRRESLAGAFKALAVTELGSSLVLLGFVLSGGITLSSALERAGAAAQTLLVLGALAKSAQYPFLIWLPDAMEAPTPVSAYLHAAAMVKAGLYLLARLSASMQAPVAWLTVVIGCVSMLAGSFLMLFPNDVKRVLAYSTISHLGLLTSTVPTAGLVPTLVHFVNHAVAKALLFLTAGAVEHETGKRSLTELGGLAAGMPITAACFTAGFLSLAGIPLFGGFVSKWLVLYSAIASGGLGWLLLVSLLASTVFAFMGLARVAGGVFFGSPVEGEKAREPGIPMSIPMLVLAAGTVLLGVYPAPLIDWAALAAGKAPPQGTSVPALPSGAVGAAVAALLLGAVAIGAVAFFVSRGLRPAAVYVCGEDPAEARTSGVHLFSDLFRASRKYLFLADPDAWVVPLAKGLHTILERKLTSRKFCIAATISLILLIALSFAVR